MFAMHNVRSRILAFYFELFLLLLTPVFCLDNRARHMKLCLKINLINCIAFNYAHIRS